MTMTADAPKTTGLYKSSVLLASLGTDVAAKVLTHLEDREVEALIGGMTKIGRVKAEDRDPILKEFLQRMREDPGSEGGVDLARQILEQAMGADKAMQVLGDVLPVEPAPPSLTGILQSTAPESLAALVADEHPQLIALLVGQLPVEAAATLIATLPHNIQGQVAARLTEMEAPAPVALQHLERCLVEKLRGESESIQEQIGAGPRRVADILGRMRRSSEDAVMASLEEQSPHLAQKVNRYRISFEQILALDSRSIQRVLREVEGDTLRAAMKGLEDDQQTIIYTNMSERAAARLKEDLESIGPVRLRDVETAQSRIVGVARALQEAGELQINSSEDEEESLV